MKQIRDGQLSEAQIMEIPFDVPDTHTLVYRKPGLFMIPCS